VFGSELLNVVIGVIFIFVLLSMLTSWILELFSTLLNFRAKDLVKTMYHILDPDVQASDVLTKVKHEWGAGGGDADTLDAISADIVKAIYNHPQVRNLVNPAMKLKLPSFIAPEDYSLAILDVLTKAGMPQQKGDDELGMGFEEFIGKLKSEKLKNYLLAVYKEAELKAKEKAVKLADFRTALEDKFNNVMEHAGLWYKRKAYFLSFFIGLLLAIGLNVDTIGMTRTLWDNPALREQVALTAEYYVNQDDEGQQAKALEEYKKLDEIGFPIGWSFENADHDPETPYNMQDFPTDAAGWAAKVVGILITGLAVAQGSPFWYDLLNKLVNLRVTAQSDGDEQTDDQE
jgi:hypothetical protein